MTLIGVMAVALHYFTDIGKPAFQHYNRVDLWRNLWTSLLYFVLHVRCRRKESSRSLSHLLVSFLLLQWHYSECEGEEVFARFVSLPYLDPPHSTSPSPVTTSNLLSSLPGSLFTILLNFPDKPGSKYTPCRQTI